MGQEIYSKKSIVRNLIWKMAERGASIIVSFAVTMVLARLLEPEAFGLAAMITVFVNISTIFVTSGLGTSLIQKKNTDALDFSTMFWINVFVSILLYAILFFVAPVIAAFYGYPLLSPMLRVLSLRVVVSALNAIQMAYISKNMLFRHYFYSTLSGKVASGVLGIGIAFMGGGVWALVVQALSLTVFETVVLWFRVGWRPHFEFSLEKAKTMYAFAWKIMVMSLVETMGDQVRSMIIGKKYTSADLAYYDKGLLLPNTIIVNISFSLTGVMFPVLSHLQDEEEYLKEKMRQWIGLGTFLCFPVLAGLIAVADETVTLLYSEKWLPCVVFMQLACVNYGAWLIEIPIRETIKAKGYANICMKMQIVKTVVLLVSLLISMNFGVRAIAVSGSVCAGVNMLVSLLYGKKYLGYRMQDLFKDIFKTGISVAFMACVLSCASSINVPIIIKLVIEVFIGGTIYILFSYTLKNKWFQYCLSILKRK